MPQYPNPLEPPPRAFISYARADGEPFAVALLERLEREQPEITLWQDRARMEGGVGWWKQITDALDQVEFLIMVMTPAVITSEVARKEWRYARQQGVRVCPVMGVEAPKLDFTAFPSWMRKAHFYDLAKEWDTFVSFLKSARKDNRVPFMAPDLRDDFVHRPKEFEALLETLLDRSHLNPVAITTALQGSGGFGKTTLAIALCHDENVISAFDDGILWATLGESPNIHHELTKLYAALTGERPAFVDVDDAAIQIAMQLDYKNCLIVIDDEWDPNHVKPFLRGGKQCGRLITTRRLQVVTEVGASRVLVNEMTEEQSVRMLSANLQSQPPDLAPLRALARRLGEWPLLLKLAASQLRERIERGDSLEGALVYVNRALDKRGVVAFDRTNPSARSDTVAKTVAASLDLLRPEDRRRCAELSIFHEDKMVPLSAIRALWRLDGFDTEELVQQLDGAALIDFDLKTGCIRIHDVLQSYLHSQLDDPRAVHTRLVHEGWRDLYTLPDSYAWRWIGWHLAQAGEPERLKLLLVDFKWLRRMLEATDVQAVLQDFELVRDSAELRVVQDALRLAANGLTRDPGQLGAQLQGRLERGKAEAIDRLLDGAAASVSRPWLTLSQTSLTHPGGALIGILKAHMGSVEAVALSPDGRPAVSASGDWTLRVWDLDAGRVLRILEGHSGLVHCVALTPDGRRVISGSEDRSVRVWDLESGKSEMILRGHYSAVTGVAVGPDGRLVASVSDEGMGRVWNLETGRPKATFKGCTHQLGAIAMMPDNRHAIFAAGDWTIWLIDLETGSALKTFEAHSGVVRALAVVADGRGMLSGSDDRTLRLWDMDSAETVLVFNGHSGGVNCVAVTADGRRAVSGSTDQTLRVWNLETGELLQTLEGHSSFVRGVAITPSGARAVSASGDKTMRYWNLDGSVALHAPTEHPEAVSFLAISADGRRAVSGSKAGVLHVWDADDSSIIGVLGAQGGHNDRISSLRMTADGRKAITASRDRTLRVWELDGSKAPLALTGHGGGVGSVELSADGTRAISISRDRTIRLWNLGTGRVLRVLVAADNERGLSSLRAGSVLLAELETGPIVDVIATPISPDSEIALSPDGNLVVFGSHASLCVWNLETGTTIHEEVGDFDVVSIAIDAEGRRAVVGSRFGALRVWDLARGRTDHVLEGHGGGILDIVISADALRAVTAAADDTIQVWDLGRGNELAAYEGPSGNVDAVAIAPSGKFAFSVYGDTIVASSVTNSARLGSISLDHQITALAVAPDGRRLALGDESGRVHFLRL